MRITLNKLSALRILRAERASCGRCGLRFPRVGIATPSPAPAGRWSSHTIDLTRYGQAGEYTPLLPLDVAVPSARSRLRIKAAKNTVYSAGLPACPALDLGNGLSISSPELLFVETVPVMANVVHVLLGYELCGSFARSATDPRNGDVSFGVPPVTSVERISSFIESCKGIRGIEKAREHLQYVANNAWAPTEALIASLLSLPIYEYGYSVGQIELNKRFEPDDPSHKTFTKSSRVPDIMIMNSPVGINYDGEDHLDLGSIARAAFESARLPEDSHAQNALEIAMRSVRSKVVDDKHRDRELGSQGLFVVPVTKEDLYELGRFEALVHLVLDGIEHHTGRDMSEQRSYLANPAMRSRRQELVWSLLPGSRGRSIALTLASQQRLNFHR